MGSLNQRANQALQAAADALEADLMETYRLQKAVAAALAESVRRAEAAMRLEMWLQWRGGA